MSDVMSRRAAMTLYSDAHDPVGHIVRIVLAEKDVTVDVQFITHETRPEDLHDLNPYQTLLTLIDRDLVLYDPGVMLEYLDERYPHPPLTPMDPLSRATHRQIRARIMRDLYGQIPALAERSQATAEAARAAIRDTLVAIAPAFSRHKFFLSDEFSLADCCLGPLLWRLSNFGIRLPAEARALQRYADSIFGRPAFAAALSPVERAMHRR
jgi:stringent starvation protein A